MELDPKLLSKYIKNGLSADELIKIIQWKEKSVKNEDFLYDLMKIRILHQHEQYHVAGKIGKSYENLQRKIHKKKRKGLWIQLSKYAAIIGIILSLSYLNWKYLIVPAGYSTVVVDESGRAKKISLLDGTEVWINKSSELKIPNTYSEKNRQVILEGEAFFDVKKVPGSGFTVQTDIARIKVLGTSFNLKTLADGHILEAVLVTGKVWLTDSREHVIYQMTPGEKVSYNGRNKNIDVHRVDPTIDTSWRLNQITFENATLSEIAGQLESIYGVTIRIGSEQLANRKLRCVLNQDETIEEVLEILKYLCPLEYSIENEQINITNKNQE